MIMVISHDALNTLVVGGGEAPAAAATVDKEGAADDDAEGGEEGFPTKAVKPEFSMSIAMTPSLVLLSPVLCLPSAPVTMGQSLWM